MSEALHAKIADWATFVRAFEAMDVETLKGFPPFLDELVWEREYRTVAWKEVPYRKIITEFLKRIDEHVVVPVNMGAYATIKEAKRLLAPEAIGFSSFDAGTEDMVVLNDPEKPCAYQFATSRVSWSTLRYQRGDAIGRRLDDHREPAGVRGAQLGDERLDPHGPHSTHPSAGTRMAPWEQDRLMLQTLRAVNETYTSPYARRLDFPIPLEMPPEEREVLQALVSGLKPTGIPDTVAYLTEEELTLASKDLEAIGYEPHAFMIALTAPPSPVDYFHAFLAPR